MQVTAYRRRVPAGNTTINPSPLTIGIMTIPAITVQGTLEEAGGTIAVTAPYWRGDTLATTPGTVTTDLLTYGNPSWWLGGDSESREITSIITVQTCGWNGVYFKASNYMNWYHFHFKNGVSFDSHSTCIQIGKTSVFFSVRSVYELGIFFTPGLYMNRMGASDFNRTSVPKLW